jgi:hypothetical protein
MKSACISTQADLYSFQRFAVAGHLTRKERIMDVNTINHGAVIRTFDELSHEEQIALVRAHAEGRDVELFCPGIGSFEWTRKPMWLGDCAYRLSTVEAVVNHVVINRAGEHTATRHGTDDEGFENITLNFKL